MPEIFQKVLSKQILVTKVINYDYLVKTPITHLFTHLCNYAFQFWCEQGQDAVIRGRTIMLESSKRSIFTRAVQLSSGTGTWQFQSKGMLFLNAPYHNTIAASHNCVGQTFLNDVVIELLKIPVIWRKYQESLHLVNGLVINNKYLEICWYLQLHHKNVMK